MYIVYGDWCSSRPMLAVTKSLIFFESRAVLLLKHLVIVIKDMYGNTSLNLVILANECQHNR